MPHSVSVARSDFFAHVFAWSAVLASMTGCGLGLDFDPPSDAGAGGMDAASSDASAPCTSDGECDDGDFCNGEERCGAAGVCRRGSPPTCDDGIACTTDRCDAGNNACAHDPQSALCDSSSECGVNRCDADLGCVLDDDDGLCDDGVACTTDVCLGGGCAHAPDDSSCPSGQFCAEETGCVGDIACSNDSDCPARVCRVGSCVSSFCSYDPLVEDFRCGAAAPCAPSYCTSEGACVVEASIPCAPSSPCERTSCTRGDFGRSVVCERQARDGLACPGGPCGPGLCIGTFCEVSNACASADPCQTPMCTASGCSTVPVDCGPGASCGSDGACRCDPGRVDCLPTAGCECAAGDASIGVVDASVGCVLGFEDCNGDGMCECNRSRSYCDPGSGACLDYLACPTCAAGQRCCPCSGSCFATLCLACCMFCPPPM